MGGYKLATYDAGQGPRAGIIAGEMIVDAAEATGRAGYATVLGILEDWDRADGLLSDAAGKATTGRKLADVKLLAPLPRPVDIYCAGANYKDHAAEMTAAGGPPWQDPHDLGLKAWHFIKASSAVVGPDATVAVPPLCKKLDWEVELVTVIGRRARNLTLDNALGCVAGYTVGNDLSARDLGRRPPLPESAPFYMDWTGHKSFEGSCPLGPWIIPAADIADVQKLGLKLWVNGVLKQDSNTEYMIYTLAEQIVQLSSRATLQPGDLVMTGTPAGVGAGRNEFLKSGDVVKAWVEGIGDLTTVIG